MSRELEQAASGGIFERTLVQTPDGVVPVTRVRKAVAKAAEEIAKGIPAKGSHYETMGGKRKRCIGKTRSGKDIPHPADDAYADIPVARSFHSHPNPGNPTPQYAKEDHKDASEAHYKAANAITDKLLRVGRNNSLERKRHEHLHAGYIHQANAELGEENNQTAKSVAGFCVKCKKKVDLTDTEERENADARKHVGKCPGCGTEVHKFAEKAISKGKKIKGAPGLTLDPQRHRWVKEIGSALQKHGATGTTYDKLDKGKEHGFHIGGDSGAESPQRTLDKVMQHLESKGFKPEPGNRNDAPGHGWGGVYDPDGKWHSVGIYDANPKQTKRASRNVIKKTMATHGITDLGGDSIEDIAEDYGHHVGGDAPEGADHVEHLRKVMDSLRKQGFKPEIGNDDIDDKKAWMGVHDPHGYWHSVQVDKK